jgi:Family of unknown function (DUF6064)
MPEWWSYTLTDFLLFSPRVYYRLFELYNRSFWPIAIVSLAFGLAMLVLLLRPTRASHRIITAILGALWIWIAWAFFWQRYAGINWAASHPDGPIMARGRDIWTCARPDRACDAGPACSRPREYPLVVADCSHDVVLHQRLNTLDHGSR